jgi:hypothetical protein
MKKKFQFFISALFLFISTNNAQTIVQIQIKKKLYLEFKLVQLIYYLLNFH